MAKSPPAHVSYKDAGVDTDAADRLVEDIKTVVRRTHGPRVLGRYGAFAGVFSLDYNQRLFKRNYRRPLLVASTDSVGTKLLVAQMAGRYRSVGQDLVAMSVNDILVLGAEPLFFLDCFSCGKLDPQVAHEAIAGIADACILADCALLGGETAEVPGLFTPEQVDMVGFAVGVLDRQRIVDGSTIQPGDVVLGLASNGLHSNGYSLVRKVVFEIAGLKPRDPFPGMPHSVADELLRPTRIYVRSILRLLKYYRVKKVVHGMAHITGGGLVGNIPRILPDGCRAIIRKSAWPVPKIFSYLAETGNILEDECWRVFNMGIGYVLVVAPYYAEHVTRILRRSGETVYKIGKVAKGSREVVIK